MPRSDWFAVLTVAMMAFAGLAATGPSAVAHAESRAMILPVDPEPLVVETEEGERDFTIEIADDDRERAAGLMFREQMDDTHGMLFVFQQTRRVSFWMKNTPMPLDLVFIDGEGRIAAVLQGEPYSTAPIGPDAPVRFVLELKAGTAQKAGIADGDRVRHPEIDSVADAG